MFCFYSGPHESSHSSVKAKIAKQMASSKLLDILRRTNPLADTFRSSKDSSNKQKLPLHFLSHLSSSQSSSSTANASSSSQSTPPCATNAPVIQSQLPTPCFNRTSPILNPSLPVKHQYPLVNGHNTTNQVSFPVRTVVPSLPTKSSPFSLSELAIPLVSTSISSLSITSDPKFILNPTGLLQECMMKMKQPLPVYTCANKVYGGYTSFECTVRVNGVFTQGNDCVNDYCYWISVISVFPLRLWF